MFVVVAWKQPEHPGRVAVVVIVALIVVNFAFWGARAQVNGPPQKQLPVEIQSLAPLESDLLPPQGDVNVDLRDQFTGQLGIDGQVIPKDQTTGDPNLGEVFFRPGPGQVITEFSKGRHTATIEWWPRTIATAEDAKAKQQYRSYSWSFNVG